MWGRCENAFGFWITGLIKTELRAGLVQPRADAARYQGSVFQLLDLVSIADVRALKREYERNNVSMVWYMASSVR